MGHYRAEAGDDGRATAVEVVGVMYDEPSLPPRYDPKYRPYVPPLKKDRLCRCSEVDDYGRPKFIGWCGPDCEGRPLIGRHRRRG